MRTYDWMWYRFSDILFYMDCEYPQVQQWLVEDFKKECYYNRIYDDDDIWLTIIRKFEKYFDEFMWREQELLNSKKPCQ